MTTFGTQLKNQADLNDGSWASGFGDLPLEGSWIGAEQDRRPEVMAAKGHKGPEGSMRGRQSRSRACAAT